MQDAAPVSSALPSTPLSPRGPAALAAGPADRIELLQTFVRIVEAGSLSAAALQLGATQPTVSRRLQALERSLGVRLLHRSTHAMALTEDGERCFARGKELLAGWSAFESDLRGVGDEPEGLLRVVAPHAFGQQQLVEPLAEFLRRYPRVSVEWLLHDRPPDFIGENIDCAIQVGAVTDPSVVAIKLAEVPRIVVAAPSLLGSTLPQDAEALVAYPWLALHTFYRHEIALKHAVHGGVTRIPLAPRISTDSLYALRHAALLGLGVCVASAWLLGEDLARGDLVHLVPEWEAEPLPVYLVYPPAPFYPAKLKRFLETMRNAMPHIVGVRTQGAHAPGQRGL